MAEQIGLLGGTFDPVHNGHISIANAFISSGFIDELWILPSPEPPHKDLEELTEYEHRKKMLELAFPAEDKIVISDIEAGLPRPSYTIQTVEYLKNKFPRISYYLCLGEDSLLGFEQWYRAEDLVREVMLLVAERPGQSVRNVRQEFLERVRFVEHQPLNISSSELRKQLTQNQNVDDFIPGRVLEYIRKEGLYQINRGG